ncbi:MAG TPA: TAXI family TRAP transporter solute-binding subunit [Methylophilaceae bacterium]|nr:TAXI family TRAP transporter solute-binding subunit [Methylophilaceae bacterium]
MISIKSYLHKYWQKLSELYGRSILLFMAVVVIIGLTICLAVFAFFNTAAPTRLTIAGGPPGSIYQRNAEQYKKILAKEGVTLTILTTGGSTDNLKKLADPHTKVDVGFVQGGETDGINTDHLMSLGSVSYQPLIIFYRGESKKLLSDFAGERLDIGPEGSGTHTLALTLLKANGIEPGGNTRFVHSGPDAVKSLLDNQVDALFVMGDSAPLDLIKKLVMTPGINIFNFTQADGYTRRVKFLSKLVLPEGALDLGKNIPVNDLYLVAPTVELVARDNLHPALSDVLLEAAREVHGQAGLFRKSGEFPTPLEHEFRISPDAQRYYTSGKSFLYRNFPFWLASLLNRLLAVLVPIALLLVPALKFAPSVYRWRMQSRIYPWYKALLELERDAFYGPISNEKREHLLSQLDHIEQSVNKMKVPASFGDVFYGLRGHINFVRNRLRAGEG